MIISEKELIQILKDRDSLFVYMSNNKGIHSSYVTTRENENKRIRNFSKEGLTSSGYRDELDKNAVLLEGDVEVEVELGRNVSHKKIFYIAGRTWGDKHEQPLYFRYVYELKDK